MWKKNVLWHWRQDIYKRQWKSIERNDFVWAKKKEEFYHMDKYLMHECTHTLVLRLTTLNILSCVRSAFFHNNNNSKWELLSINFFYIRFLIHFNMCIFMDGNEMDEYCNKNRIFFLLNFYNQKFIFCLVSCQTNSK